MKHQNGLDSTGHRHENSSTKKTRRCTNSTYGIDYYMNSPFVTFRSQTGHLEHIRISSICSIDMPRNGRSFFNIILPGHQSCHEFASEDEAMTVYLMLIDVIAQQDEIITI